MSDVPEGYKRTEMKNISHRLKLTTNTTNSIRTHATGVRFSSYRFVVFLMYIYEPQFMADFAQECPEIKIGQQSADQLPWFVRALPEPLDISLPSVEEIEAELSGGKDE